MTLRIGFDLDGVLADFASAYREVERSIWPDRGETLPVAPEDHADARPEPAVDAPVSARDAERRRRAVWDRIRATTDFWTTLQPTEPGVVARLAALTLEFGWEVVFVTQRPATAGQAVQRQSQLWLAQQGFEMPSVVVIAGSRGAAIHALRLTHHVDDSPQNCVDVKSDSAATPILVVRTPNDPTARQARKLGIGVAASTGECLDLLERASVGSAQASVIRRLAALVNWSAGQ